MSVGDMVMKRKVNKFPIFGNDHVTGNKNLSLTFGNLKHRGKIKNKIKKLKN